MKKKKKIQIFKKKNLKKKKLKKKKIKKKKLTNWDNDWKFGPQ